MDTKDTLISHCGAAPGDLIRVKKDGKEFVGILIPSHDFSDDNITVSYTHLTLPTIYSV